MADTGEGVTIGFGTTSIGQVTQITMPNFVVDEIETTHLGSTNYREFISSDLTDPGQIECDILWDPTSDTIPARGANEVVTVTWPIHTSGNTTNATFVADGFVKEHKLPDFAVAELQTAHLVFRLDGKDTEPAFTAESA